MRDCMRRRMVVASAALDSTEEAMSYMSKWCIVRVPAPPVEMKWRAWIGERIPIGLTVAPTFGAINATFFNYVIRGERFRMLWALSLSLGLPFVLIPKVSFNLQSGDPRYDGNRYVACVLWLVAVQFDWVHDGNRHG